MSFLTLGSMTKRVELFNAKKFMAVALRANDEAFVVHVASILGSVSETKNVLVTVPTKYSGYNKVFPLESAADLPKHTSINNYSIVLAF